MSKQTNEAKWEKISDTELELKQCAVHYTIKHPDLNDVKNNFSVTLTRTEQSGTTNKAVLNCKNDQCGGFNLSKQLKQACIDEMKIIGKEEFDNSFEYLYGNCNCNCK